MTAPRRKICTQPLDMPCVSAGQRGPCRLCSDLQANSERMKALHADPDFAKANSERMKALHADRLSWLPPSRKDEYDTLKKYMTASEARAAMGLSA